MTPGEVRCQQCSTSMAKTEIVEQSRGVQAIGLLLFVLGAVIMFVAFPIGAIVGVLLMVGAWRMGYTKKPVWKCPNCSYFFVRAD